MKNDWPVKKLGEVILINPSKQDVLKLPSDTPVSFVSMASINQNVGTISNIQTKELSEVRNGYTYFANNDVLFAKITPCMENGKIAIAQNLQNGIGFGTTEVHVLRSTNQILPKWTYYIVNNDRFREEAEKHMTGSAGQQRVPKEFLENVKIPVPPMNNQKKIVERLNAIRKAQELCDQQIQKTEELFESILTNELNKLDKTEIRKLNKLCLKITDGAHKTPTYTATGIPFLSVRNMINGTINFIDCKFISEEEHKELIKRCNPEYEDIVIAKSGTTGVATLVDTREEFSLFVSVALLKINRSLVLPRFMVYFLNSRIGKKQMIDRTKGGTIKNLHIEEIREITIPTPSLGEQQKVVEKLEAVQNYKKLLLKQKELLKELFDSVLDKSMKGELDN